MMGKSVGDTVVLPKEVGPDQTYEIAELKHKYVWLLHEVMAAHGTRFPDSNALVAMTMGDGDIQPILDAVKVLSEADRQLEQTYVEHPVPLAAIAAMSQKTVAEDLVESRTMSVGEVALRVGYASTAAFSRAFKAQFARAPTALRPGP